MTFSGEEEFVPFPQFKEEQNPKIKNTSYEDYCRRLKQITGASNKPEVRVDDHIIQEDFEAELARTPKTLKTIILDQQSLDRSPSLKDIYHLSPKRDTFNTTKIFNRTNISSFLDRTTHSTTKKSKRLEKTLENFDKNIKPLVDSWKKYTKEMSPVKMLKACIMTRTTRSQRPSASKRSLSSTGFRKK